MGMLAERAGYKEPLTVPDYSADELLDAVDVDAVDVDEFEPSFIDLEQTPYME